jgi:hypothetical protein
MCTALCYVQTEHRSFNIACCRCTALGTAIAVVADAACSAQPLPDTASLLFACTQRRMRDQETSATDDDIQAVEDG